MTHGQKLQALREEAKLSQYRLAKLSGVSQAYISKYERGENNVGLETLQKVCPVLGVSVAEFLLPEPFAVALGGEVVALDKADPKIEKILHNLQEMDGDQLNLVESLIEAVKSQKK